MEGSVEIRHFALPLRDGRGNRRSPSEEDGGIGRQLSGGGGAMEEGGEEMERGRRVINYWKRGEGGEWECEDKRARRKGAAEAGRGAGCREGVYEEWSITR